MLIKRNAVEVRGGPFRLEKGPCEAERSQRHNLIATEGFWKGSKDVSSGSYLWMYYSERALGSFRRWIEGQQRREPRKPCMAVFASRK